MSTEEQFPEAVAGDPVIEEFIDWAISFLEDIASSPEKTQWCKDYDYHSDDTFGLEKGIRYFMEHAYDLGFVITDYREEMERHHLEESNVIAAKSSWVSQLSFKSTLACIAYHFRWDHFCECNLENRSIADGMLLRLFRHLKDF